MALIKCIECGKEFSDRALSCPNCGCPVDDTIGHKEDKPQKVEVTGVKVTKKIKVIIGVVVVLLALGGATVFGVNQYQKKKAAEEYVDFVTGKAAQTVIANSLDRRSVRKDVEAAAYLPDKEKIHMITADEERVNEKKEQWQQRFVEIFKEVSGE